jgi:hypothetical protein
MRSDIRRHLAGPAAKVNRLRARLLAGALPVARTI